VRLKPDTIHVVTGIYYIGGNTKALTIRLTLIVIGVAIIFGLSEFSKQVERVRGSDG
jgi:hypothetical protein